MNIEELNTKMGLKTITVTFSYEEIRDLANGLYYLSQSERPEKEKFQMITGKCKFLFDMIKCGFIQPETIPYFSPNNPEPPIPVPVQSMEGLSEEEIDTFNAYLAPGDMETAFGNSDFCHIYSKIVGNRVSDDIQDMILEN